MHRLMHTGAGMPSWGVRINTSRLEQRQQDALSESCPAWAKPRDWLHYGVVVWDDTLQRVEVISFGQATNLLDHLRSTDAWKSDGVVPSRKVSSPKQPEKPPAPRSRKKRAQPVPDVPPQTPEESPINEEQIRLRNQAALDFYVFLECNEAQLRRMRTSAGSRKHSTVCMS